MVGAKMKMGKCAHVHNLCKFVQMWPMCLEVHISVQSCGACTAVFRVDYTGEHSRGYNLLRPGCYSSLN